MHILLLQIYHIYCLHLADMCDNMSVVIRLQKLAMPATGRKTCGPSFFIPKFYGRIFMQKKLTKPFITYSEQINNLIKKKHLDISNRSYAENKLLNIGYYSLIDGYKDICCISAKYLWKCSIVGNNENSYHGTNFQNVLLHAP